MEELPFYTHKAMIIYNVRGGVKEMQKTIEALYEKKGMFKPLMPVELNEGERIEIEIKIMGVSKIKELSDKYFGIVKLKLKKEEMRRTLNKIEEEIYG